jgi:transposase
VVKE